jgi:phosphonate dehydrogenase
MRYVRIVISHRVHRQVTEELTLYGHVYANNDVESLEPAELASRSADADALMVFMPDRIDREFLKSCPKLKIIACALKGFDNIDLDACTDRGIWVSVVQDLLTAPTADLAVGLLLALTRRILQGDHLVRSKYFPGWRPVLYGSGLQGKTAGIIGFGRLGRMIARRLKAFDLDVRFFDPLLENNYEPEFRRVHELDQLIRDSNYMVLATPLLPSTFHLFDRKRLAGVKPGAFLVNVGRGSVVDEKAVAEALSAGLLGGYAADVYEMEDLSLPDRPRAIPSTLLLSDRTVFTPHLGSAVAEIRLAIERAAAANIIDVLLGNPPRDAVNRVVDPQRSARDKLRSSICDCG